MLCEVAPEGFAGVRWGAAGKGHGVDFVGWWCACPLRGGLAGGWGRGGRECGGGVDFGSVGGSGSAKDVEIFPKGSPGGLTYPKGAANADDTKSPNDKRWFGCLVVSGRGCGWEARAGMGKRSPRALV